MSNSNLTIVNSNAATDCYVIETINDVVTVVATSSEVSAESFFTINIMDYKFIEIPNGSTYVLRQEDMYEEDPGCGMYHEWFEVV